MSIETSKAYTVTEAGAILDLPVRVVNRVIDRELPRSVMVRKPPRRLLSDSGLMCLVVRKDIAPQTPVKLRKSLFKEIARHPDRTNLDITNFLRVDLLNARKALRNRLERYRKNLALIETSDDVLGGEPHFRNTRISVFAILGLLKRGAKAEELLEDYPRLTKEMIEAARLYARARPRRGRPVRPFWRAGKLLDEHVVKRRRKTTP